MRSILAERPSVSRSVELITRGLPWPNAEALAHTLEISLDRVTALLEIPPTQPRASAVPAHVVGRSRADRP
jgi:hypothetical protein